MKAIKCTLNITIESLSKDCFEGMIKQLILHLNHEYTSGELRSDDGDYTSWTINETPVEF